MTVPVQPITGQSQQIGGIFQQTTFLNQDFGSMHWLSAFLPLMVENESFIAGGVFKDMLIEGPPTTPKDIDVFFYNAGGYNNAVERFRASQKYEFLYNTSNSMGFQHKENKFVVDLVCYQFGTPMQVIDRFDFTVCKMAFYRESDKCRLVYHHEFTKDLANKSLNTPVSVGHKADLFFNRIIRYVNYGFRPDISTKRALFNAIRDSSLEYELSPVDKTY